MNSNHPWALTREITLTVEFRSLFTLFFLPLAADSLPEAKAESPLAEGEEGVSVEGGGEEEELSLELEEILKTCDQIQQRVVGVEGGVGDEQLEPGQ